MGTKSAGGHVGNPGKETAEHRCHDPFRTQRLHVCSGAPKGPGNGAAVMGSGHISKGSPLVSSKTVRSSFS